MTSDAKRSTKSFWICKKKKLDRNGPIVERGGGETCWHMPHYHRNVTPTCSIPVDSNVACNSLLESD